VVGDIPTVTDLGSSTTTGSNPQVVLVATVLNGIANPSGGAPLPMPTGTVTFNSGTTMLGTVTLDSSGVALLVPNLTPGVSYSIVAVYSGDALHSPSTSAVITVSGTPTDFGITVTPNTVTLAASQNATLNVTLTSNNGFTDTIGLGCGSLPAGVTCQFSVPSVALAANGTQTAQLIIDTNNPLSGGTTAMNSRTGNRGASLAGLSLLSLPFSALLGLIVWRFRKRHTTVFTTILALILSGAAMLVSGCNGISLSSATPGTYVIQVIGVGTTTGDNNYQNVTVTITK
jgi:large repetitive protein